MTHTSLFAYTLIIHTHTYELHTHIYVNVYSTHIYTSHGESQNIIICVVQTLHRSMGDIYLFFLIHINFNDDALLALLAHDQRLHNTF